jgi:predicted nuclease of restriction endonuclease-like (RecB) superfamily
MKKREISSRNYSNLLDKIANILVETRTKVVREINKAQVLTYWEIGREIVEFEQKGKKRAGYGEELLQRLSIDLTDKFGKGFSAENLRLMRKFYLTFGKSKTLSWKLEEAQKCQTPSGKFIEEQKSKTLSGKSGIQQTVSAEFEPMLSWSHYCELLKVEESFPRSFYEQEAIENNWSVRGSKDKSTPCFLKDWL